MPWRRRYRRRCLVREGVACASDLPGADASRVDDLLFGALVSALVGPVDRAGTRHPPAPGHSRGPHVAARRHGRGRAHQASQAGSRSTRRSAADPRVAAGSVSSAGAAVTQPRSSLAQWGATQWLASSAHQAEHGATSQPGGRNRGLSARIGGSSTGRRRCHARPAGLLGCTCSVRPMERGPPLAPAVRLRWDWRRLRR